MSLLDSVNRQCKVEVLPDERRRVTRRIDLVDYQATARTEDQFAAKVFLPWGTADEDYPECRLTHQDIPEGQIPNPNKSPNDPPPYLIRVYEQIDEESETPVGGTNVTYDDDGNVNIELNWIQFSTGTPVVQTVGVTAAPAPYNTAILKDQIATDDGTVRQIRRIYNGPRTISDVSEIRFGGKMIVRTITAIGDIPPTPVGYTLVGPGVLHPDGRQIYTYQFAAATGGGGTDDYIGSETQYEQSPDQGTTGVTVVTIRAVVPQGGSNPIVSPGSGYELIDFKYDDETGVRMWTAVYAKGQGLIESTIDYRNDGKLVIYTKTAINAAPSAPSPTIGGTVVLINNNVENGQRTRNGTIVYRLTWAEGNGVIDTDQQGEPDGALVQTITTLSAAASTPTSPGADWYLINLDQRTQDGCYLNRAVYKKPPATKTFGKKINFTKPGVASIGGSPVQLSLSSQVTMTLLADVEVSYAETQISDTPFTVSAWAQLQESWTPTDTGIQQSTTKSLGGYLAEASGTSGTNSVYNGILCDEWSYELISSVPSTFGTGAMVLDVDNDPYLTAIDGTVVYRRTKVSYTF